MAYETNAQKIGSALFKNAGGAANALLDVTDAHIQGGVLEPLEDGIKASLKPYIQAGLMRIHREMGAYAKFAGDAFDDADAFVTFLIQKADEAADLKGMEPLSDAVMAMAKPYLVTALKAKQAKLAEVKFAAEA